MMQLLDFVIVFMLFFVVFVSGLLLGLWISIITWEKYEKKGDDQKCQNGKEQNKM